MFEGLTKEIIERVLRSQLDELRSTAEKRGYQLSWDQAVFDHLLTEWTPRAGARWVFNILRNRVEEQLALAETEGELAGVTRIEVRLLPMEAGPEVPEIGRARRERRSDALIVLVA